MSYQVYSSLSVNLICREYSSSLHYCFGAHFAANLEHNTHVFSSISTVVESDWLKSHDVLSYVNLLQGIRVYTVYKNTSFPKIHETSSADTDGMQLHRGKKDKYICILTNIFVYIVIVVHIVQKVVSHYYTFLIYYHFWL